MRQEEELWHACCDYGGYCCDRKNKDDMIKCSHFMGWCLQMCDKEVSWSVVCLTYVKTAVYNKWTTCEARFINPLLFLLTSQENLNFKYFPWVHFFSSWRHVQFSIECFQTYLFKYVLYLKCIFLSIYKQLFCTLSDMKW